MGDDFPQTRQFPIGSMSFEWAAGLNESCGAWLQFDILAAWRIVQDRAYEFGTPRCHIHQSMAVVSIASMGLGWLGLCQGREQRRRLRDRFLPTLEGRETCGLAISSEELFESSDLDFYRLQNCLQFDGPHFQSHCKVMAVFNFGSQYHHGYTIGASACNLCAVGARCDISVSQAKLVMQWEFVLTRPGSPYWGGLVLAPAGFSGALEI